MFELLQPYQKADPISAISKSRDTDEARKPVFTLDRATIVTNDIPTTLAFYAAAFGWEDANASEQTLKLNGQESAVTRYIGKVGFLELEILAPSADSSGSSDNIYTRHLTRGSHGLVHTSGLLQTDTAPEGAELEGEWLESGERFLMYNDFGVANSMQIRLSA